MALKIGNRQDDNCALCRAQYADKTGSHLAPNFMIHKMFSFDGKGRRDREIAMRETLNKPRTAIYYGPQVSVDAINTDHGGDLTDEELKQNENVLEIDNLFCKRCEERFGVLETAYSIFYQDMAHQTINPKIAYLFWISVFWRMAVGRMALFLNWTDEQEMRRILDELITDKDTIEHCEQGFGDFGYVLWHADGLLKGDSGIFGTRTQRSPYMIIVNDMVVMLVANASSIHKKMNYAGWEIEPDSINRWNSEEVLVNEISLEDFALLKRFVIDESYQAGRGPRREEIELYLRECDRTAGYEHSVEMEELYLKAAIELDREKPQPKQLVRNARRFMVAEMKLMAARDLGQDYDYMKDRTLFLFPFDETNYRNDLLREARKHHDVSSYPMAEQYVPAKFIDKTTVEKRKVFLREQLDNVVKKGYSLDALLRDNWRTKE